MFRVKLDPDAVQFAKDLREWRRKDNTKVLNSIRNRYANTREQRAIIRARKLLEAQDRGEQITSSKNKRVTGRLRIPMLPRSVRESWASEETEEEGNAPEVLRNSPVPEHLRPGHNNPPELIETPEDDVLAEKQQNVRGLDIAQKAMFLLDVKKRYKVLRGGRNSAKSWSIARALLYKAMSAKELILCVREFQNSIADSVHRLISNQISLMGLDDYFDIQQTTIICKTTGTEFIFKGMHRNIKEIKSTEGVTICWLEEAQSATEESIMVLFPTIRGSTERHVEIWISFNPFAEDDPIYTRFGPEGKYIHRSNTMVVEMNWNDNPWFGPAENEDRIHMMIEDPDVYDHVWEGKPLRMSDATILRGKFRLESFETPANVDRFFYGVDWGFSTDPVALVRFYIVGNSLYIDKEAYAHNVDIEDLAKLFDTVPGSRAWPMKGDNSRPETISYMARQGFNITAAEKWPGSVEDGIAHLRGFDMIYIHPDCVNVAREARMYSWKRDKKTNEVLPVVEDKHNHTWDAIRYGLDGYIQARGGLGVWMKLIGKN